MNGLLRTVWSLRLLEVRLHVKPLPGVRPDLGTMLFVEGDCLKGGVNPLDTGLATSESNPSPPTTL